MCRHLYLPYPQYFIENTLKRWFVSLNIALGGHGCGIGLFTSFDNTAELFKDGFQVWSIGNNTVRAILKGVNLEPEEAAFYANKYKTETLNGIIYHARLASVGGIHDELCQPFPSGKEAILTHNGTWSDYLTYKTMSEYMAGIKYPKHVSDTLVLSQVAGFVPISELTESIRGDSVMRISPNDLQLFTGSWGTQLKILYGKIDGGHKLLAVASEIPNIFSEPDLHVFQFNDNKFYRFWGAYEARMETLPLKKANFDVELDDYVYYTNAQSDERYTQTATPKQVKSKKHRHKLFRFFKGLRKSKETNKSPPSGYSTKEGGYKTLLQENDLADPKVIIEVTDSPDLPLSGTRGMSLEDAQDTMSVLDVYLPTTEDEDIEDRLYQSEFSELLSAVCGSCTHTRCVKCEIYNTDEAHLIKVIERRMYRAMEVLNAYV